ncbi:MAG: ATP-binding protein [Candidatus Micrarchaeota archaeon]|nr:ATP-binding protein [Candidatus Micrarchaeota archaeon]
MEKKVFGFLRIRKDERLLRLRFGEKCEIMHRNLDVNFSRDRAYSGSYHGWRRKSGAIYICPQLEANPHVVISGMSGFGKSTLFKSLLFDIRKSGISCILFDAHDEHSTMVRNMDGVVHNALYSGINILELDGASVSERISELSRLLKEVYSLGYIQATKLSECLWYTYRKAGARSRLDRSLARTPTVKDLIDELSIFIRNSKSVGERNTLVHLRARISLLNSYAFTGGFISMEGLNDGLHSFSLGGIKSKEVQLIYIGELLNRLYATMHDSDKQSSVRLYVMIDEAQFLVDNSNNNSVISKLIEEGRKYGLGVIIVTHAASTLNRKIMANCATFATFYAREPSEINYISRVLSGSDSSMSELVKARISRLRQNQAIIVSNHFRDPVVVSTPKFDELPAFCDFMVSGSEAYGIIRAKARRPIRYDDLRAMGVDLEGSLEKLEGDGTLDSFTFSHDGNEERWIMAHNSSVSIEHEVMVMKISELLKSHGLMSRIVDNSKGPDIISSANGKRIAIEYETGSKSNGSTLRMISMRLEKYPVVLMITNDAEFQHYKEQFGSTGIDIIPASDMDSIIAVMGSHG